MQRALPTWIPVVLAAMLGSGCELFESFDLGSVCDDRIDEQIEIEAERHARLRSVEIRFEALEEERDSISEDEYAARARALLAEREALLVRDWRPETDS